jgi:hypothetical protein
MFPVAAQIDGAHISQSSSARYSAMWDVSTAQEYRDEPGLPVTILGEHIHSDGSSLFM